MQVGQLKDPRVFPYQVKGFKPGKEDTIYLESRRDPIEAKQSADRFRAEGCAGVWIFKVETVSIWGDVTHG